MPLSFWMRGLQKPGSRLISCFSEFNPRLASRKVERRP